jgi:hypothetical protein
MLQATWAGLAYFGIAFAAGFGLGTLRVTILAPKIGETVAVFLELPIILAVSWAACRWLVACFGVSKMLTDRLIMGGVAFAVLMVAEIGVSVLGFGRTLSAHLEHYRQMSALIGLAGQVAFALFPILQRTSEVDQGGL